jgi:hypothetical protein
MSAAAANHASPSSRVTTGGRPCPALTERSESKGSPPPRRHPTARCMNLHENARFQQKANSPPPSLTPAPLFPPSADRPLPTRLSAGAKRTHPAPTQCPKKSQNVPNPSMHLAGTLNDPHTGNPVERTHRALLSGRSESKGPTPPKRPKPRQTTPLNHPCKTKPSANSAVPPLYIHPHPCYTCPNNCQSLRLSLPEDPFQNPFNQAHQLSHSSCRVKPSGFPVFRWVQYSPLHLRKSVSNGF